MPPVRQNKGKEPVRDDPLSQHRRPQTARRGRSVVKADASARTRRPKKAKKEVGNTGTADLTGEETAMPARDTSPPSHLGLPEPDNLASQIMFPPENFPIQQSWPPFPIESSSSSQALLQRQEASMHQLPPRLESVPMQREQPAFPIQTTTSFASTWRPGPGSRRNPNSYPNNFPIQHHLADPLNRSANLPIHRGHPSFSNESTPLNLLLQPWPGSQSQPALPNDPTSSISFPLQTQPLSQPATFTETIPPPQYDDNQNSLDFPMPFDEEDLLRIVQEYENELQQDTMAQPFSPIQQAYDQFDPAWYIDENDFSDLINPENQTE